MSTCKELSVVSSQLAVGDVVARAGKRTPAKVAPASMLGLTKYYLKHLENNTKHLADELVDFHAQKADVEASWQTCVSLRSLRRASGPAQECVVSLSLELVAPTLGLGPQCPQEALRARKDLTPHACLPSSYLISEVNPKELVISATFFQTLATEQGYANALHLRHYSTLTQYTKENTRATAG